MPMTRKPNIILISLDTVRADHLSCYGYNKPTTPNIDKLAEDGVLFKHAYSTAVWTPPAHASMLTGLYPSEHGVVDQNRLDPSIPTIAEILLANGYHTAGFVNNSQVGELVGLHKGHETFVEVWRGAQAKSFAERAIRYAGRKALDIIGLKDHGARLTNHLAIKWLEEVKKDDKPFYLFLHYIDAHNPLKAPIPYHKKFLDKRLEKEIDKKKVSLMADNPLRYYTQDIRLTEYENEYLIALYDGEIAYLDSKVGEIVSYLKQNNLYDNSILILTADHGEHFGEHGHYSHVASLYQPIIHIPMIIKRAEGFKKGITSEKSSQLVDLLPTILGFIRVEPKDTLFSGIDLFSEESSLSERCLISEWEGRVPYFILLDLNCDKSDKRVQPFTNKMFSIIKGNYKYIISSSDAEELFDIASDDREQNNLIQVKSSIHKLLKTHFQEWKNKLKQRAPYTNSYEIDEETKRNLQGLGYM